MPLTRARPPSNSRRRSTRMPRARYAFDLDRRRPLVIDPLPVIAAVLDDVAAGTVPGTISARFHRAVVACIVSLARGFDGQTGIHHVALSGGVFLNRFVLEGAMRDSSVQASSRSPTKHYQ
jgi:hydrogenase maturation protein HypF